MNLLSNVWEGRELGGGRYLVGEKLGEGGMAFVFKAHDRNLDTTVVLKIPKASLLEQPDFLLRFQRETRSLVKLSHPHIVKVLDVGEFEGRPFLVLQFLGGGSLSDQRCCDEHGRMLPLPAEHLWDWLDAVSSALDFMHEQKFIHRDVKPGNILFDSYQHAYLSDFGIAKALGTELHHSRTLTGGNLVLGTPDYMAPEMIRGLAFDGRADQYSLAITVFEMLSGRCPFVGPTPSAVLVQQSTEMPPPLHRLVGSVPLGVSAAVERALAKNPQQRFASCREFCETILSELPRPSGPRAPSTWHMTRPDSQLLGSQGFGSQSIGSQGPGSQSSGVQHASAGEPQKVSLACPQCGLGLLIPASFAGQIARCPSCKLVVTVALDLTHLTAASESQVVKFGSDSPSGSSKPSLSSSGFSGPVVPGRETPGWNQADVPTSLQNVRPLPPTDALPRPRSPLVVRLLVAAAAVLVAVGLGVVGVLIVHGFLHGTHENEVVQGTATPEITPPEQSVVPGESPRELLEPPTSVPDPTVPVTIIEEPTATNPIGSKTVKPGPASTTKTEVPASGPTKINPTKIDSTKENPIQENLTKNYPTKVSSAPPAVPVPAPRPMPSPEPIVAKVNLEELNPAPRANPLTKPLPQTVPTTPNAVTKPSQPTTKPAPSTTNPAQPAPAFAKEFTNGLGMKLMLIPAGEFWMGSPDNEFKRQADEARHRVRLTKSFYMGAHEVTQSQYTQLMHKNPSAFAAGGIYSEKVQNLDTRSFPVDSVSWTEAVEFCQRLSDLPAERNAGRVYRLPTEAEWEYACRAGTDTPFSTGFNLGSSQANANGEFPAGQAAAGPNLARTCMVGLYRPNAFGLYDMHGNIWEWCQDWYEPSYLMIGNGQFAVVDPLGPPSGTKRVNRGGGYFSHMVMCRSALRYADKPIMTIPDNGFRVVCDLVSRTKK